MKSCFKYFVLLLCLISIEGSFRCDYEYNLESRTWFKFFVVPATWFDARLRCSLEQLYHDKPQSYKLVMLPGYPYKYTITNGARRPRAVRLAFIDNNVSVCIVDAVLASPTSREILDQMKNIINTSNPEFEIFTGIHATFSQGDYYTIEGTSLSDFPVIWAKNEPDNKKNQEKCITLNGIGELADHRCEETRPYICYRPERFQIVSECGTNDPEYSLDKRTNKCYKFHTVPRNYSRAFSACSAEGGHLAVINSDVEATVLKELFGRHPANQMAGPFQKDIAFIGFHDWGEIFDWRTIHGQSLTEAGYNKFNPGQPDNAGPGESCGAIFRNGLLDDLWCDRPAVFICEKNPGDFCNALIQNQQ